MNKNFSNIKYLFEPRTIAVIGASASPGKIGNKIVDNIINAGYRGKVFPINPNGGELLGYKVYKSLHEITDEIDVVAIAIPAKYVFQAVKDCAAKHVKFLTIISSGFSEVGNLDGEHKIRDFAREHGMRILGPNIFGHYSAVSSLNASFGPKNIKKGHVAIITPSGALGVAMIGKTSIQNIGLSAIISVGNKSDLDEADLLEYLLQQDETRSILMYIEGVQKGERLVETLKRATKLKPIVVIKSGRSKRGAIAAASHTGSLAGSDEIFDAIMKQCGVLRSETIQGALDWCKYLSNTELPKGKNTVIITNGGGVGVLATDACEKFGVHLYDDKKHLKEVFESVTHGFGSTKNPIDLTGDASAEEYIQALTVALEDDNIHSVISLYCETAMMNANELAGMIEQVYAEYKNKGKPIIFSVFGGEITENSITILSKKNVPIFRDIYESASPLGALYQHLRNRNRDYRIEKTDNINIQQINRAVKSARDDNRKFLLAHEGQMILEAVGLPGPQSGVAKSIHEAVDLAESIGYPVVMKVVSRDILHKSDVGGVLLDLENKSEVLDAYQTIIHNCKAFKRDAVIDGIEVVEQVRPGTEVIIGGRQDKAFGPVIMFGLGGSCVDVMKDISFRALPVSSRDVSLMVKEIRSYPLLLGVRGEARKDIDQVKEAILKVGSILMECREIADIEINPLMVYDQAKGVKAVDIRILLSDIEKD